MTRRRLVALVAVFMFVAIGLVVVSTSLIVTRTQTGREWLRGIVVPYVQGNIKGGTLFVGKIGGNLISGIEIDSIAIRDKRGDLFLSTGRVTLEYNWRDLIDYRIYIRKAHVEHPYVHIVQHANYQWNFREIFASRNNGPPKPKNPNARSLGDYIVLDSVSAVNTTFLLTMPWTPDENLRGAARDSTIRYHLATPSKMVSKTFDGYGRTWAWRNGRGLLSHVRLADPDSDKFGREFRIATMSVDEFEPTFQFRNVQGVAKHLGDTVFFNLPHFELPASVARGSGRVWWGSDRPIRVAVDIHSDSVQLNDVNWVYPDLPRTGGGKLDLVIRNDARNEHIIDYRVQNMDVRSTKSHLTGDMWFGAGAPVLLVRNVDVRADPMNFDLIRTLNGKPFPYDWQGDLIGSVKGPGGPLTNFRITDARGRFEDAHVRGAVSRFTASGELDILKPAYTAFHGFDVNAQVVDLRTIEYLNPAFPRIGGIAYGTARLDSSWLDVRFSNASLFLQDGPGVPSHLTGNGRITTHDKFMEYDVALQGEPLNLTMLARSRTFAALPARGLVSGPIRAKGMAPDLQLETTLEGTGGAVSFLGRVDLDSIGGYGAHGHGQFSSLDLAALLERDSLRIGKLSGHYEIDVAGETAGTLQGSASVDVEATSVDGIRVYPAHAAIAFADGRLKLLDTLRLRTDAARLAVSGGIGLPQGRPDSLDFFIVVDSLGGLRPSFLRAKLAASPRLPAVPDSLGGTATISGVARGTLDALQVSGRATGTDLYYNRSASRGVAANFSLDDLLGNRHGIVTARLDSAVLGGVTLDSLNAVLRFDDSTHVGFSASALSHNGPTAAAKGRWSRDRGTNVVALDSLGITIGDSRWRLASAAQVVFDSTRTRLDSLLLRNADSGVVSISANVPEYGPAFARLSAMRVPLRDVSTIAQLADTLTGMGNLEVSATGTRLQPIIGANASLLDVKYSGVDAQRVDFLARYKDSSATAHLSVMHGAQTPIVADAKWPFAATLFSLRERDDAVDAQIRIDTTELAILRPLFGQALDSTTSGKLAGNVTVSGKTRALVFNGNLGIRDGVVGVKPLGVRFEAINGDIRGEKSATGEDSIAVLVSARTSRRDSVQLSGWVKNLAPETKDRATSFDLRLAMDSLHAFNRRSLADLYITTTDPLRLAGNLNAPQLTGALNVDRGAIYLADRDLARKLTVDVVSVDTAGRSLSMARSAVATKLMTNLKIPGVPVTFGQDVRLRSTEANVRLGGELTLLKSTVPTRVTAAGQLVPGLALEGELRTLGGTYTLNLGLAQREFNVLNGGTVTFDGPTETPIVDIKAQYNVKQYRERDLGVVVNLYGRMPNPKISFTSTADYEISTSDLLSYLITGRPGFDFAAAGQTQLLASFLAPTISAAAAAGLRRALGGFFDVFQFELGTSNADATTKSFFTQQNLQNYLYSASLGTGKQLTSNLYVSANAAFCGLSQGQLNSFAGRLEYRFRPDLSLQATYDPPTVTSCTGQSIISGLVPTPAQYGFLLSHTWRF